MIDRDKHDFDKKMDEASQAFDSIGKVVLENMRKMTRKQLAEALADGIKLMSKDSILEVAASIGASIDQANQLMPDAPLMIVSNDQKTVISACIGLVLDLVVLDGKDKAISSKL